MKSIVLMLISTLIASYSFSQEQVSTIPSVSFSFGFVSPQFYSGTELMKAYDLRQSSLSYFESENGQRKEVGDYGINTGFTLGIAFYIPIQRIDGLNIGLLVNSGQTGSSPSGDGYAEAYFFNFLNFGLGMQYYPLKESNFYLKAEAGMGSVFTKNRFIDGQDSQDFLHHFGIGLEGGGGLGYTLRPFKNKKLGINLEVAYQLYSTRVEVSKIGDDRWQFGALNIGAGLQF